MRSVQAKPSQAKPSQAKPSTYRAWLEYVADLAIDLLDRLDAPTEDVEDDEIHSDEVAHD